MGKFGWVLFGIGATILPLLGYAAWLWNEERKQHKEPKENLRGPKL